MAKVLLVEDDDIFRDAVLANLAADGHDVVVAENGRVATAIFDSFPFELVITDVQMPEMDGVEFTKAIRCRSQVPIIMMTGFSDMIEAQEAYHIGANSFVPKPFQNEDLAKAIFRCLNPETEFDEQDDQFCKLGINDFVSGKTVKYNIFVRVAPGKFIKLAHRGEDLSLERIDHYRRKGLHYLYLRHEDFRQYVGFNLTLAASANKMT